MSRRALSLSHLRAAAGIAFAVAGTTAVSLYVLHQHAVGHAAPEPASQSAGSISVHRAASDRSPAPTIDLKAGSYHASSVLTDCGAITWTLTTGIKEGTTPDQEVIVGYDSTGDPLAPENVVNGYHIDPRTGMAPQHTTPYQVDFTVSEERHLKLEELQIDVYNNTRCTIDLTITRK